jgi:TRAP-type C4-dicarboxylate transport system permease small subunit
MDALIRLSNGLRRAVLLLAGVALLGMLTVTVIDVLLRTAFTLTDGASTLTFTGSVELVRYLMLAGLLGALAGYVEQSQVVVEVFTQRASDAVKARIAGVSLLVFALVGAVMAVGLADDAASAAKFGEITQDLAMPKAPIYYAAAALLAVFTIRSAVHGLDAIVRGRAHEF